MVRNHSYRNGRDRKEERRKNDLLTQVEGRREETCRKHQLRVSVCRMSGASSPFIGRAHNKNGETWGSIRSDPQVTAFCSYLGLSDTRFVLDRVVTVLFVTRNAFG